MRLLRLLTYKLFRLVWNDHFKRYPMAVVPLAESMRLGAIRASGLRAYETSSEIWSGTVLRGILRTGGCILIAGLPKHGKTYVAEMLSSLITLDGDKVRFSNTSDLIYEEAEDRYGKTFRDKPKEQIRETLCNIGDELCEKDPAAILKELFSRGSRVIAGVRKVDELRSFILSVPTFVIWVDRPGYERIEDNTNLTKEYCDIVVSNDEKIESTLKHLLGL